MALCKNPMFLKQAGGIVPCGQCFTCRLNKARFWTFRLMMEARLHEKTFWTTLTYDRVFLPFEYVDRNTGQIFENSTGTLSPRDIELFLKRVRKYLPPRTFKFFVVGEYGDRSLRPHYHLCIFGYGEEILPILRKAWTDPVSSYPLGFIDDRSAGPINTQNARYTVGYTLKKLTKIDDVRLEGRYPEFFRSSKGIGLDFAKRFAVSINTPSGLAHMLATGDIPRVVRYDGRNWPLDRYMREKVIDELARLNNNPDLKGLLYEKGREKFRSEMHHLSNRSEINPQHLASTGSPTPTLLQKQYTTETRQRVLNTETRAKLFLKEKEL